MPNLLDGILSDDGKLAFCSADEWGESLVYTAVGVTHGTGTAVLSGGGLASITLVTAGSGYASAPVVRVTGDGVGARAAATVSAAGVITGFTVTAAGSGYTTATITVGGFVGVVERDPPVDVPMKDGSLKRPKMIVSVPVATIATLDAGGATITVAYRLGGTAAAYKYGTPINQDGGMWRVPIL